MSAHSPGPWRAVELDGRVCILGADNGTLVLRGITTSDPDDGIPVLSANERLISAAPELLEALKRDHFLEPHHPCLVCALIVRIEGDK